MLIAFKTMLLFIMFMGFGAVINKKYDERTKGYSAGICIVAILAFLVVTLL